MHLPDHYLDPATCAITAAAAAAGVAVAGVKLSRTSESVRWPIVAATTAGIFAAQMVNYPVAAGTSGHLVGAALAAALLGPWCAIVVMTTVLALQAVLFGDGGLAALGANVLNMGVAAPLVAHWVLTALGRGRSQSPALWVVGVAAWISVMVGATLCSLEMTPTSSESLATVLGAMLSIHAVIGLSEALITVAAVMAVRAVAPRLTKNAGSEKSTRPVVVALCVALLIAIVLSPLASSSPDGLEATAASLGFGEGEDALSVALLPDYSVAGWSEPYSTATAGAVGVVAAFALALAIGLANTRSAAKG